MTFYLAFFLAFHLSYNLTFYLAIFLAFYLTCVRAQGCSTAAGAGSSKRRRRWTRKEENAEKRKKEELQLAVEEANLARGKNNITMLWAYSMFKQIQIQVLVICPVNIPCHSHSCWLNPIILVPTLQ